jgi:hypothetical protein
MQKSTDVRPFSMRPTLVALTVLLVPVICTADDFMALPGLWKTTYRQAGQDEPKILWHCVAEDTDPWVAFAQLEDGQGMSCTLSKQERTSTSLEWRIECKGAAAVTGEGRIVFDSTQHYTGSVKFTGTLWGYPLQSVTQIEGKRYAVCTSPRD